MLFFNPKVKGCRLTNLWFSSLRCGRFEGLFTFIYIPFRSDKATTSLLHSTHAFNIACREDRLSQSHSKVRAAIMVRWLCSRASWVLSFCVPGPRGFFLFLLSLDLHRFLLVFTPLHFRFCFLHTSIFTDLFFIPFSSHMLPCLHELFSTDSLFLAEPRDVGGAHHTEGKLFSAYVFV